MLKSRLAAIGALIVSLAACSGGGPSHDDRQNAFLQYVKDNSNDKAKIRDFESGKCVKAEGAPSYNCAVASNVMAMDRDFGHEMDGVYAFTEVGDTWKITGRVQ
ncbi:hypothetical protein CR156_14920 [Stenotrophomonas lactitubi]|uniref:hypothetical protein n=1 Tax=Stenotrophomonas TaxID=40323 RepID=UPI000C27CA65|nr:MULTISPECIES: hypothetical protein [Stenotrophomonas]MBA0250500.1 hypothetical protein [Stenotrophomonas maltophilia]MBA0320012.1 hypothetical protein [Stenotrophomonas maltophilia]PJO53374.1 hypothetical protein CR156_14920 [Stenotrophomonas lactitubi]